MDKTDDIKTALIASILNIVIKLLLFSTDNINILVSGIYLGVSKQTTKRTVILFMIINFIFYFVYDGLFRRAIYDPERGITAGIIIHSLSSMMLSALPLFFMWLTRKIKKPKNEMQ